MLSSVCAVGVVGGRSGLLAVVAVGEAAGTLASMVVVVGRERLLIVCGLLMTTNRASGFAVAYIIS